MRAVQRGLSGTLNRKTATTTAGMTPESNIRRHVPACGNANSSAVATADAATMPTA